MSYEVGQEVLVISRDRIRAGRGPRKMTITEVTRFAGPERKVVGYWCGRVYVGDSECYGTQKEAKEAGFKILSQEWQLEADRYEAIKERLRAAMAKCR